MGKGRAKPIKKRLSREVIKRLKPPTDADRYYVYDTRQGGLCVAVTDRNKTPRYSNNFPGCPPRTHTISMASVDVTYFVVCRFARTQSSVITG
ncbi:MAG: hypothetical protein ACQESR_25370, partial [Planctomycetota bacterium]